MPVCPLVLRPQPNKRPSVVIPKLCAEPQLTTLQLLEPILTGLDLDVGVPSPSCPELLSPQPHREPSALMPMPNDTPADTTFQLLVVSVGS